MMFQQLKGRNAKRSAFWLFLIGCFSMTQIRIGAKIGISEIACLIAMPVILFKDYRLYSRDGVAMYFNLLIFWMIGAIFSDYYNNSEFEQFIRGFSVPLLLLASSVCIYHFLRGYTENLKWLIFGIAVSSVISIFVFQRGVAGDIADGGNMEEAIEKVIGYKLFWSNNIKTCLLLPIKTMYLKLSNFYVVPAMISVAVVNAMSGGRSAFAVSVLAFFVVIIGGKRVDSMRRIKRYLPILFLFMIGAMVLVKTVYTYAASHGYLSESEIVKYEKQTTQGSDIKSLMIAGRGDFFIGLFAAIDKPFIGHGSQALDHFGYEEEYLHKYGTPNEIARYLKVRGQGYLRTIRSHSHVICYWMWHGIAGLAFWMYILHLVVQTFRRRMDLIPAWFGFLAIAMSDFLWDYFFSPLGLRVSECTLFCALLLLVRMENLKKKGIML